MSDAAGHMLTPTPRLDPRRPDLGFCAMRRGAVGILLLVTAGVAAGVRPVAAAPGSNVLTNGTVTPGSGTVTTSFLFSVDYSSPAAFAAISVVAVVAGKTVPLTLVSGTDIAGTYRGSALLPAGSWPITFQATATKRNNPTLLGPTVVVLAPTPTPRPTLGPTPAPPAATPTPAPTAAVGSVSPSPGGGASTQPSGMPHSPGGSGFASVTSTPSAAGGGGSGGSLEDGLGTFLTGGLAAILLLAAVGFTAIWRDRRRETEAAQAPSAPPTNVPPSPPPRRRSSAWERDYAVQDEPIGTVEFEELTQERPARSDDPPG